MGKVKNPKLADDGEDELAWARENMPILARVRGEFEREKPLAGLTVGVALHLEKKTGILLETLKAGGARIYASSCNPLTTDDKVAAALAKRMNVFAWAGQSAKEYYRCLNSVLDGKPEVVIDDGCDLIFALHKRRRELLRNIKGACEETTTGITRLKAMEKEGALGFPVFAVNNAYSKFLFDNRYGTGQSTIDAITHITNKLLAGKVCAVFGYGWCGRGIASRLRGLGANVIVVETAATLGEHESGFHRALEALYDGFRVMDAEQAALLADIFITATGNKHILTAKHFARMKSGAILANAGHFNIEIDEPSLRGMSKKVERVKDNIQKYELKSGRKLYLLSEGRLVNLARPGGQGHPIEIMDGSFAIQALCVREIAKGGGRLKPKVYDVPRGIDERVAELALLSQGVKLGKPTREQVKYSKSWDEGT